MNSLTILQGINAFIVSLGIPTVVIFFVYIGRKLETVDRLDKAINDEVRPDLKDVRERFAALEGRTTNAFKAASPISLTDQGKKYLEESGLKKYIDDNKEELLKSCATGAMKTSYDLQQAVFEMFDRMPFKDGFEDVLKEYSFSVGLSMPFMRRVGAIYFRDICLDHFKMDASELDGEKK